MVATNIQFKTFSVIRDILLQYSSTIRHRLKQQDFYMFEPKMKSLNTQFPYIVIKVPTSTSESANLKSTVMSKEFVVEILFVMDYVARDNYTDYITDIINTIESNQSKLNDIGLINVKVDLIDSSSDIISQKNVITGTMELVSNGTISR